VHGDGFIHLSEVDRFIEVDEPLPGARVSEPNPAAQAIGRFASEIIEDGACLQVGIGSIPDAVLRALSLHRNLGIHSEMWSDGALELIRKGVVDNSRKLVHPGKTVSAFVTGSQAVYDFIDDNPSVIQLGTDYVNNPAIIARNPKATAINSALEVDLTGQVCADSLGHRVISGVGGQLDFMRGATLSEGGKAIIALTSRSRKGIPRIVATLRAGAGVVTPRAQVRFVVTEYGVADLFGLTLNERANALMKIAHPEDRDRLAAEWRQVR
jgi:acyl-CoA hydrolase